LKANRAMEVPSPTLFQGLPSSVSAIFLYFGW
jgi:hypothetical protein